MWFVRFMDKFANSRFISILISTVFSAAFFLAFFEVEHNGVLTHLVLFISGCYFHELIDDFLLMREERRNAAYEQAEI